MRRLLIATVLTLLPTAAFAQSAKTDNALAKPGAQSSGAYGPPAPAPTPSYSGPPQARSNPTATESAPPTRHRGHHRGAYMEADGGAMRPQ